MLHRLPSSIAYNGQGHQVRCVAFRSLFVKNPTTAQMWDTFVQAWALVYIGMPDVVTTDRGTQFNIFPRDFELALSYHGVKQQYTAVKPHHSLGANERAHAVLRRVYLRTRYDHPKFHKNWLLRIPRRRSTKLSGRIETFRHCSCTVLCRDFALPVLMPAFSRTLNVSAVWLLHELNTRGS
jgi:hypothetical protein